MDAYVFRCLIKMHFRVLPLTRFGLWGGLNQIRLPSPVNFFLFATGCNTTNILPQFLQTGDADCPENHLAAIKTRSMSVTLSHTVEKLYNFGRARHCTHYFAVSVQSSAP